MQVCHFVLIFPAEYMCRHITEGCSIGPFQLIMSPAVTPGNTVIHSTLDPHPSDGSHRLVLTAGSVWRRQYRGDLLNSQMDKRMKQKNTSTLQMHLGETLDSICSPDSAVRRGESSILRGRREQPCNRRSGEVVWFVPLQV